MRQFLQWPSTSVKKKYNYFKGEASVLPAPADPYQRAGEQETVQVSLDLPQPEGREGAGPLPQQVANTYTSWRNRCAGNL